MFVILSIILQKNSSLSHFNIKFASLCANLHLKNNRPNENLENEKHRRSKVLDRAQLLTQKLLQQGYVAPTFKSSLHKLYVRYHNLVDRYEISISQKTMNLLLFYVDVSFLYHCHDFYRT